MNLSTDIVILGSGFAGSLCGLMLRRAGFSVVLADKSRHPRFAIGESSTPIANIILRDLARKYEIPELAPLSRYGEWRKTHPDVICGKKRGFTYFNHERGAPFTPAENHANELLVAASTDDYRCDTHWLRADVDTFLLDLARTAGATVLEETKVESISSEPAWEVRARRGNDLISITADFAIDASGSAGLLGRHLELPDQTSTLKTRSRALFSHFREIPGWNELFPTADHPYSCDDAAVHHCLDAGWMWMLRFADDRTSAGFTLDANAYQKLASCSPDEQWQKMLTDYPSVQALFESAEIVHPPGRILETGRLQRLWSRAAGSNWAMLPFAAGFIDPLHSTGIAHSLSGIERLVHILEKHWNRGLLPDALASYSESVIQELRLIDLLVAGCYPAFSRFELLVPYTMLYFAAATTYEQRRLSRKTGAGTDHRSFLCADIPAFVDIVETTYHRITELCTQPQSSASAAQFARDIEIAVAPYNSVGLFAPRVANMYEYTAADID